MKRSALWTLLLTAAVIDAAAQRVSLEIPLSPTVKSRVAPALYDSLSLLSPNILQMPAPMLVASPLSGRLPSPLPRTSLPASAITPRPQAATVNPAPQPPAKAAKVVDSLREHAPDAAKLSDLEGEAGAKAVEANFMSAASLGGSVVAPSASGDADIIPAGHIIRPLLERMLERVRLDDRGRADEKKVLENSFKRMLETPTGRRYAEEFLAEGLTARVHFKDIPYGEAAGGYSHWRPEGYVEVELNRRYVDDDPEIMAELLPPIIGHELLGHGLWSGRAAKENLHLAFFYHELNETFASLIEWNIDHELDGRFERPSAWAYLSDPAHYLKKMKTDMPYYALTLGSDEMADAIGTLRARMEPATKNVVQAKNQLDNLRSWLYVLDHLSKNHDIPERRFELLRTEFNDYVLRYEGQVVKSETVVRDLATMIGRMEAESDHQSGRYLLWAASKPFFTRLGEDAARLSSALKDRVEKTPPAPPRPAAPRPADQVTWDELVKMHKDDVAADAKRRAKQKHWWGRALLKAATLVGRKT